MTDLPELRVPVPLTVKVARERLSKPQFGNQLHINAVHLLALLDEAISLNGGSQVFDIPCSSCDGSGECGDECHDCGAHQCGTCQGEGSTRYYQSGLLIESQIQRIIEELRSYLERSAA